MSNHATIRKYEKSKVVSAESTGGAGSDFENDIQALFATLMVCDGEYSIFPNYRISSLRFQAHADGYCTDDLVVWFVDEDRREKKLLVQCKRTIEIKGSFEPFTDSVQAAWIDFQDAGLFNKEGDAIALVTGPLSRTDNDKLGWIFNLARHSSLDVFLCTMKAGKNISADHLAGYELFREIVAVQTGGSVDEAELYRFLRAFYILQPDMWYEGGVVSSFACSLLKRHFEKAPPRSIFNEIVAQMRTRNSCGGTVSRDELVQAIQSNCGATLRREPLETEEESRTHVSQIRTALPLMEERVSLRDHHLALLALIGMWQETRTEDRDLVRGILQVSESQLECFQQELIEGKPPLMVAESGLVRILRRRSVWMATADKVSQVMVERFLTAAKDQFLLVDRRLDIDPDKRFFSDEKSGIAISDSLRTGLAEGLAILGIEADRCSRVELTTRDDWAASVVRSCLGDAPWKTWATLDDILPYLAEAAPDAYLAGVNQFLQRSDDGVGNLFAQEHSGIMGRTYLFGLLEGLQRLAWLPDYFAVALDLLARLAAIDPGGQWGPRPKDVIQRILHPCGAHTIVEPSVRVDYFSALLKKYPNALWDALLGLLPSGGYSFVDNANEPVYRRPEAMKKVGENIPLAEAIYQFDRYEKLAVDLCGTDIDRIIALIESAVEDWRNASFQALVLHLQEVFGNLAAESRHTVWKKLRRRLFYLHLQTPKSGERAEWFKAREETVSALVRLYEPSDPRCRFLPLFGLSEEREEEALSGKPREEIAADIERRRRNAVEEIWKDFGTDELLAFASRTDLSPLIGKILGEIASAAVDSELLPDRLRFDCEGDYWLIVGYVRARFDKEGWPWVDNLVQAGWSVNQRAMLFVQLPFGRDTWNRLPLYLGDGEELYWRHVDIRGKMRDNDVEAAISGFLKYGCCYSASEALSFTCCGTELPRSDLSRRILSAFVEDRSQDRPNAMSAYHVEQMIKAVQRSPDADSTEIARYEWRFFELFEHGGHRDFSPIGLNRELATNPRFFYNVLEWVYMTETEAKTPPDKREARAQSEAESRRTEKAWRLLDEWNVVPGVDATGSFDGTRFNEWVEEAFALARAGDRLESAKMVLGSVVVHAPQVSDFWMPHEVAQLMERPENASMLRAFESAKHNSRGIHWFDKTMKEDQDLATQYRKKAEQADRFGYLGLANAMRNVAKSTMHFARLGKEEHNRTTAFYKAIQEEKEQKV